MRRIKPTYRVMLDDGICLDYYANGEQEAFDRAVDRDLIERHRIVSVKRVCDGNK